ncbi:MAG: DUF3783 domain-containing protein [Vallitaleaceae bacterium]|nr:DUF3783 domain-containing protein [Vallitaleaceae bacterium]
MAFEEMNLKDSVRPSGRNCIMISGFDGFEIDRIRLAVRNSGIDEWLYIDQNRSGLQVKTALDTLKNNDSVRYQSNKERLILFNGCSNYEIHKLISEVVSFAMERPLIAVTTPISLEWNFSCLLEELKKEREAL